MMNEASLVSLKPMTLDFHVITNNLKGMFSMLKFGLENKHCVFGMNYLTYIYLTHVPSENDKEDNFNEPSTLITAVKAYQDNQNILVNYHNNTNTDKPVIMV